MEYVSKGFRFDTQVMAWLDKLKSMHGSYNKGLRLVAFPGEGRAGPAYDVKDATVLLTEKVPANAPERTLDPTAGEIITFEESGPQAIRTSVNGSAAVPAPRTKKPNKREAAIQARASSDVVAQESGREDIDYSDVESTPTTHVTKAATTPTAPKPDAMAKWRASRRPLEKPGRNK